MTWYILTTSGRLYMIEDEIPIAELVNGFWKPPSPMKEGEEECGDLEEWELARYTSTPPSIITPINVAPLWGFTDEVAKLASAQYGYLKAYMLQNVNRELDESTSSLILIECIASSYKIYANLALSEAYPRFEREVGDSFLLHYAYQILVSLGEGKIPSKKEFLTRFKKILLDYEDACLDPKRVEQAFVPARQGGYMENSQNRILMCLANRSLLRAKGIEEDKLGHKVTKEIPDFTKKDSEDYLQFASMLGRMSDTLIKSSDTLSPSLSEANEA